MNIQTMVIVLQWWGILYHIIYQIISYYIIHIIMLHVVCLSPLCFCIILQVPRGLLSCGIQPTLQYLLTLSVSSCNRYTHASSTCGTSLWAWRRRGTLTQFCWCSVTTTTTRKSTNLCKVWTSARWCRSSTLTQYRRIQRNSLASPLGTAHAI